MPGMLHPAALSLLPHFLTGSPTRLYWSKCGWAAGLGCSNRGMWWGRDKLVSSRARHREERPGLTAQQRGGGRLQEGQGRVLKIWSWSRTTQTWNHLPKQSLPLGQENYPNSKNITLFFPILFSFPLWLRAHQLYQRSSGNSPLSSPRQWREAQGRAQRVDGWGHNLLSEQERQRDSPAPGTGWHCNPPPQ